MTSALVSDLIAARALIADPTHWIKGDLTNGNGCYCTYGAIRAVVQDIQPEHAVAMNAALPADYKDDGNDWNDPVAQFNDDPATTHADILALFDRAISKALGGPHA